MIRFLISVIGLCVPLSAGALYSVRAAGPANSVATGLAADGSVSGYSTDAYGVRTAFVFDGVISLLAPDAAAYDTSAGGMAAGVVWTGTGARATVWDGEAVRLLDLMDSYALALNDSGAVAGSALHGTRRSAFVESGDTVTWIDAGVWSAAYDLNAAGQVAGTLQNSGGRFRAFLWSQAGGLTEIGTLGGTQSWAQAVGSDGAVAGSSTTGSGYLHGFVHRGGRMTDLGTLGGVTSAAYDVNGFGEAVGYSYDSLGRSRAFVWRNGTLFDLNELVSLDSGWSLEAAYGINDRGQIAGTGLWNGVRTAFVLDPVVARDAASPVLTVESGMAVEESPVPEPGNLVAALIALGIIGLMRFSTKS